MVLLRGILFFSWDTSPENTCGTQKSKTARGLSLRKSFSPLFARSKSIWEGKSTLQERCKNKAATIGRAGQGSERKKDSSLHRMSPINT